MSKKKATECSVIGVGLRALHTLILKESVMVKFNGKCHKLRLIEDEDDEEALKLWSSIEDEANDRFTDIEDALEDCDDTDEFEDDDDDDNDDTDFDDGGDEDE